MNPCKVRDKKEGRHQQATRTSQEADTCTLPHQDTTHSSGHPLPHHLVHNPNNSTTIMRMNSSTITIHFPIRLLVRCQQGLRHHHLLLILLLGIILTISPTIRSSLPHILQDTTMEPQLLPRTWLINTEHHHHQPTRGTLLLLMEPHLDIHLTVTTKAILLLLPTTVSCLFQSTLATMPLHHHNPK